MSYIKTRIDENRKPGQWLFTGSQHFGLMQGISQSLAGRAAVLSLMAARCLRCTISGRGTAWKSTWLSKWGKRAESPVGTAGVISRASGRFTLKKGIDHYNWKDILGI